jgi:curved DNA-binding protein CbpA
MPPGQEDHYALLGIAPDADVAELRRAWRELAKRWHPDRAGTDTTPRTIASAGSSRVRRHGRRASPPPRRPAAHRA